MSVHFGVSILLSVPEIQLSPDEAKEFADAAVNVAKHYDIGASAKALAWTDFAMVAGSIYGVRVMQIVGRKQGKTTETPATLVPTSPGGKLNGADRPADQGGVDWSLMTGARPAGRA